MTDTPLTGLALRYLIGAQHPGGGGNQLITEVSYDWQRPVAVGTSIAYCNLFLEKYSEMPKIDRLLYAPFKHDSDTASQYGEGEIDPHGQGWRRNLTEQFERRKQQGFEYIELDNPDAYDLESVLGAIDLARKYNLRVIAKNPLLCEEPDQYVSHENVYGVIVERDGGEADDMDALRKEAGKPLLPVWFVSFQDGKQWAEETAKEARKYHNMSVTWSREGEYTDVVDILRPVPL